MGASANMTSYKFMHQCMHRSHAYCFVNSCKVFAQPICLTSLSLHHVSSCTSCTICLYVSTAYQCGWCLHICCHVCSIWCQKVASAGARTMPGLTEHDMYVVGMPHLGCLSTRVVTITSCPTCEHLCQCMLPRVHGVSGICFCSFCSVVQSNKDAMNGAVSSLLMVHVGAGQGMRQVTAGLLTCCVFRPSSCVVKHHVACHFSFELKYQYKLHVYVKCDILNIDILTIAYLLATVYVAWSQCNTSCCIV